MQSHSRVDWAFPRSLSTPGKNIVLEQCAETNVYIVVNILNQNNNV